MFPLCRNVTCHLKLGYLTKSWNVSSVILQYSNRDHLTQRKFSALSRHPSKLEMKKCQNSPLYLANSKRNLEYNLFANLIYLAQQQFVLANQFVGLDWWMTIILCSVPLRTAIAFFVAAKKAQFDRQNRYLTQTYLDPISVKINKDLKGMQYRHLSPVERNKLYSRKMRLAFRRVCKEHNHNPWLLMIYSFTPLPYWAANSLALRRLSGATVPLWLGQTGAFVCPEMSTGGFLWFPNLCEHDPYHALSVMTGLFFLMAIELNVLQASNYGKQTLTPFFMKVVFNFTRAWSIFFVYITWDQPSAMTFYWCVSGMTALVCRLCFIHPKFQKWLQPKTQHAAVYDEHPYKTIFTNMKRRYNPTLWFT